MRRPLLEIDMPRRRSAEQIYGEIEFGIGASGAIWDEPLLNAWCTTGCRRSARLSPQKRQQALEWRLGEATRAALDAAGWRRHVFGAGHRSAAIARRRDAMLCEVLAPKDMTAAFQSACKRFLAYREKRAQQRAALADAAIAAAKESVSRGGGQ